MANKNGPKSTTSPTLAPTTPTVEPVKTEIQKTAYGRQVKPVLVNLVNLKLQKKQPAPEPSVKKCQKSPQSVENAKNLNTFHCDICYKSFAKRTRMIRHIKNVHSADIHRVDLNKFVLPRRIQQYPTWSMIEL